LLQLYCIIVVLKFYYNIVLVNRPEAKLYGGPTVGRSLRSGKKKKKEHIFCPGSDEQYEGPVTEDRMFHRWGGEWCSVEGHLTYKRDIY